METAPVDVAEKRDEVAGEGGLGGGVVEGVVVRGGVFVRRGIVVVLVTALGLLIFRDALGAARRLCVGDGVHILQQRQHVVHVRAPLRRRVHALHCDLQHGYHLLLDVGVPHQLQVEHLRRPLLAHH